MDPLDTLLIQAWNRVSKKVREDRVLALKRSRRRFTGIGTRPPRIMREWCLVIRASDTRINPFTPGGAIEVDPQEEELSLVQFRSAGRSC